MFKNIVLLLIFGILFFYNCSKSVEFSGEVYDDLNKNNTCETNEPKLSRVKVLSGNVEVYSDSSGAFSIDGKIVQSGTKIKLYFSKDGYIDTEKEVTIDYIDDEKSKLGPVNEDNNTVIIGMVKK